jgi:hypothetical protein
MPFVNFSILIIRYSKILKLISGYYWMIRNLKSSSWSCQWVYTQEPWLCVQPVLLIVILIFVFLLCCKPFMFHSSLYIISVYSECLLRPQYIQTHQWTITNCHIYLIFVIIVCERLAFTGTASCWNLPHKTHVTDKNRFYYFASVVCFIWQTIW